MTIKEVQPRFKIGLLKLGRTEGQEIAVFPHSLGSHYVLVAIMPSIAQRLL